MRPAATLIDALYRETFEKHSIMPLVTNRSMSDLRHALTTARRFVADDSMSAFLADLANVPFTSAKEERRPALLDSLRHGALLPANKVWIEYRGVAFKRRMIELSANFVDAFDVLGADDAPETACPRIGWLLERSPTDEALITMTEACSDSLDDAMFLPWRVRWNARDVPFPNVDTHFGLFAHGIIGLHNPCVEVTTIPCKTNELFTREVEFVDGRVVTVPMLLADFTGSARYAMALLATLNEIPATIRESAPAKGGFMGGGQIRKFLSNSVISLNLPASADRYKVAKRLTAAAVRRARHQVRGHWRVYQDGDCAPHAWSAIDDTGHSRCACGALRVWIKEHERGDASIGFVTHSYAMTHHERKSTPCP